MPNWCINTMYVYSNDKNEVVDFRNKCLLAREEGNKSKQWHLYKIYEVFGYARRFILDDSSNNGYIRGSIEDIGDVEEFDKGRFCVRIDYESAWGSMYEGFDWLLERHYENLRQVTYAEECGNEVYINTDVTGLFFKEKYCFYVEDYDSMYCKSEEELVACFNELLEKENISERVHSEKDCYDYLNANDDCIGHYEYVSLHNYSF